MKIAIVGSGISGLACAYRLQRDHEVQVFEANDYVGGHTHTIPVEIGDQIVGVDTGFIVFNERNYPNFVRLLDQLGVAHKPTSMSFSLRCERSGLEYGGHSLNALFAQRRNLFRPRFHRMWLDLLRFYREAADLLGRPQEKATLGEFVEGRGYSRVFIEKHLVPMAAAIWSTDPNRILEFPAHKLATFFHKHGLLQLRDRPRWRVIEGGSGRYVDAVTARLAQSIRLHCAVRSIRRGREFVEVVTDGGHREQFDHVIVAAHSNQALALLEDPSNEERAILGSIRYQPNEVILHTDASLLPRQPRARASWNYHILADRPERASLTYYMNMLQGLEVPLDLCVTVNPPETLDPQKVIGRYSYDHPVFDASAVQAQAHRELISGRRRTHYCGAYWFDGFHEDGVLSALEVCRYFEQTS